MKCTVIKRVGGFCLLATLIFSLNSCRRIPKGPKAWGSSTIIINDFLKHKQGSGYDNCYTTKSGTAFVDYDMTLTIKYYDLKTNNYVIFRQQNYSPGAGGIKQPVTFNIDIPINTPYEIEVSASAKNCSTCAVGWGGTSNNGTDPCVGGLNTTTGKWIAAKPEWYLLSLLNDYKLTITINGLLEAFNAKNSCGCEVNP